MFLVIILALAFIKVVILYRGLHMLPAAEIKRRARSRDHSAGVIYKLAASLKGLDLLLILIGLISGSALIVIESRSSWQAGSITIILMSLVVFWRPLQPEHSLLWKYTVFASPYIYKLTKSITPTLSMIADLLQINLSPDNKLDVYEKEDLLAILDKQSKLPDNRIPEQDLQIASSALTFGDKKIVDVMVPRRKTRFVSEAENIGPMLMDELHKTGHTIFPVIKASSKPADPEVSGMLSLNDLIDNPDKTKVKDIMQAGRHYIDESHNLRQALDEFIKTKSSLLVVTDNFQEVVGVINIDQVLEQVIGKKLPEETK